MGFVICVLCLLSLGTFDFDFNGEGQLRRQKPKSVDFTHHQLFLTHGFDRLDFVLEIEGLLEVNVEYISHFIYYRPKLFCGDYSRENLKCPHNVLTVCLQVKNGFKFRFGLCHIV